jgi:DNA repair protein RecN (Recombination protein N)
MLTHLQLKDLVIVDAAELEFGPGLTALTGETGAGKSIVVDALLLIAGGRGGGDVVRQGAERAEVAAGFTALSAPAVAWLDAQAIAHDAEIIVRRVIGADGRSRAYVNGQLVPLQQLREFAEFLIEIHGQQEFQHLVKRGAQREMLDELLDDPDLEPAVAALAAAPGAGRRDYDSLKAAAENRESRLELLRYQQRELDAEVTTVAAIEELFAERKRISGLGRLGAAARTALTAVYEADADSAHDLLAKASAALRAALDADAELAKPAQLLTEATILVHEAADGLRRYLDSLDVDPGRQDEVERHAAALESLARKHRQSVLDLPAQRIRIEQELRDLDNAELSLADLERRLALLAGEYGAAAQRLTQARLKAAADLSREITRLMQTLGMAGGRFTVSVRPDTGEFSPHGGDDIEFLVSANPGQPPKSLAKVASGGELSRISLAVQVASAARASSLCMVFDEVDAGIGGGTAEIVGRQLRELGRRELGTGTPGTSQPGAGTDAGRGEPKDAGQVLCVTHLAQVAAQAHTQFRVVKQSDGKTTRTLVTRLTPMDRVDEIARMLGGVDITEQARAHAREMLTGAAPAAQAAPAILESGRKPRKSARSRAGGG